MTLLDPRVWLAAIALIGAAYLGGRWQQHAADNARYQAERTAAALAASEAQRAAIEQARGEERRRAEEQTRIAENATKQMDAARADARAAGVVSDRLRARVAELLATGRPSGNPAPASGGPATGTTDALLAELFRRADARAGSLAADLDAARSAGVACERSYDALTVPVLPSATP